MKDTSNHYQDFRQLFDQKDPKLLIEYLKSAPEQNLPELYEILSEVLVESNKLYTDVELFRQQAEKFRPVMHFAVVQLIHLYLQQGEMLSKQNEAIAQMCKRLLKVQYNTYMVVFNHARKREEKKGLLAISIHRIMVIQLYLHIISYFMYSAIAGKEWLNLHRLAIIAEQNGLSDFSVEDRDSYVKNRVSISKLYAYALIMGCASLHKLNVESIIKTIGCIFEWSDLVKIDDKVQVMDNDIVVDISAGLAPNFHKFFTKTEDSIFRYIHLDGLLAALEKQTTQGDDIYNKVGLTDELKSHLIEAWSNYRVREERVAVNAEIESTIGFKNIHYYLCGARELKDFLGERVDLSIVYDEAEQISIIEQQRSNDVWAPGLSVPSGNLVHDVIPETFSFQQFFEMEENSDSETYPKHQVKMIDKSLHGCCLELPRELHFAIAMGELIAFRDNDTNSNWQIGEIAWFKITENQVLHVGIRLLNTKAIPLGADVPLKAGVHKNYTESILLPYDDSLKLRTSIIFHDDFFKEEDCMKIVQKGLVKDLKLTNIVSQTDYYSHFNCGLYASEDPDDPKAS